MIHPGDEPITTGDAELVTGRMEQSRPIPYPKYGSSPCGRGDSVPAVVLTFRYGGAFAVFAIRERSPSTVNRGAFFSRIFKKRTRKYIRDF